MRKKTKSNAPDPEYLRKQKAALVRKHRMTIRLNDSEMAAINEYCSRFSIKSRAALMRKAALERIMAELDNNHPTLF